MSKTIMKIFVVLILLLPNIAFAVEIPKAELVLVKKSERKMYLIKNNKPFREYKVAFGANPEGHKQQEGDERTPEGKYILDYKKSDSAFYKAIHISYPNEQDRKRAKEKGVNPGGLIMIHGQKNGYGWLGFIAQSFNWTDGCIAVKNIEMDEIWISVNVGTPIIIKP
jgi:murein L,D-transpeptidase YafK